MAGVNDTVGFGTEPSSLPTTPTPPTDSFSTPAPAGVGEAPTADAYGEGSMGAATATPSALPSDPANPVPAPGANAGMPLHPMHAEKGGKKGLMIALIAGVLIIAVMLLAVVVLGGSSSETDATTTETTESSTTTTQE
ncbi:MAG: hypothetical protein QG553_37 [Patescibacteria group bacterium]|nr:hypothetical protein [Patescibacteria group bacterium]